MKTNLRIMLYSLITSAFCTSQLFCSKVDVNINLDKFFASPQLVAEHVTMAPLRPFFEQSQLKRSLPDDATKKSSIDLEFYSQAMTLYVTGVYNKEGYAKRLSQDGTHIIEFLTLADEFNFNTEAVYTGLRLFFNKLKEVEIIDDTVVIALMNEFPAALENYFPLTRSAQKKSKKASAAQVEGVILTDFTNHLQAAKTSTTSFFRSLSEKIAAIISKNPSDEEKIVMRGRLRELVIKFVEMLLSKIMWYPQDHKAIWESVIGIAHNIHLLGANGVINHMDDVDDLLWSLVHRFSIFLGHYGSELPVDFYESIEHDITNHLVFFLESPELDECITPKREKLIEALGKAKAKALATRRGLIVTELAGTSKKPA